MRHAYLTEEKNRPGFKQTYFYPPLYYGLKNQIVQGKSGKLLAQFDNVTLSNLEMSH